jgi:hypothetical protein
MGDDDYDEGYWPPAKYPRREAFTIALACLGVIALVSWLAWKLL